MVNKSKIIEKLDWGKIVSAKSDNRTPPYSWYSFKHRFGSEFVSRVYSMFRLRAGDTVFDPYCGGGTTLIKAKMNGINAIGLDISPFSVFLTNVLTRAFKPDRLKLQLDLLAHEIDNNVYIPDVGILKKSFSNKTLKYIYSLKTEINTLKSRDRDFFIFSLLCILDEVSKAKKSGGFLRITDQRMTTWSNVKKEFVLRCRKFTDEMRNYKYTTANSKAYIGDSRNYPKHIKGQSFDAILTSPPYPNRHDYTRIYELELLVGFLKDNDSLKKLRYSTLRSHVEARQLFTAKGYSPPVLLKQKLKLLGNLQLNNPKIVDTLIGYFEDMFLSLREMHRVLKPGRYIGLVVSNVRFSGVMIPVDELLAEVGESVGLKLKQIYILRYRGNSPQQMSQFKREPCRESLVVWTK